MVRGVAKHVKPLVDSLAGSFASGQGLAQYAVPAVATAKSGGLFGSSRVTVPLSEPLPGVNIPTFASPKAPELQVRGGIAHGPHMPPRPARCITLTLQAVEHLCISQPHNGHSTPTCLRTLTRAFQHAHTALPTTRSRAPAPQCPRCGLPLSL